MCSAHLCKKRHRKDKPETNGTGCLQGMRRKDGAGSGPVSCVLTFGTTPMFHTLKMNKNEKNKTSDEVQTEHNLQINLTVT